MAPTAGRKIQNEQEGHWLPSKTQVIWAVVGVLLATLAIFLVLGYIQKWEWVGVAETLRPKSTNQDIRREKTLWDWMQLLIIPVAITVGTFALNQTARRRDEVAQQAQKVLELDIEDRRTKDEALQTYLNHMGDLLLKNGLRTSEENSDVRILAWAYTLTLLRRLSPDHKRSIVDFLYGAGLIIRGMPVIPLGGSDSLKGAADLSGTNLVGAHLNQVAFNNVNLKDVDLRGATLQGADLSSAHLSGSKLDGADLSGAYLSYANLSDAWLLGTNLAGTNLTYADLSAVKFRRVEGSNEKTAAELRAEGLSEDRIGQAISRQTDLRRANLQGATGLSQEQIEQAKGDPTTWLPEDLRLPKEWRSDLKNVYLVGAHFSKADLTKVDVRGLNMSEADLTGANLTGANLGEADLTGASLTGANLGEADLTEANLTEANLTEANLTKADLSRAVLERAELRHTQLTQANLREANLMRANLIEANLRGADLTGANLGEANLTEANLTEADVSNSDLSKVDLTGANLGEADLRDANLRGADLEKADLTAAKNATWKQIQEAIVDQTQLPGYLEPPRV